MIRVCVLLSTYNGERFLQEQLNSLYIQQGVELLIVARDDGSSDGTLTILQENADKHPILTWYQGENLGPMKSFFNLLVNAPLADYYAFCDQDDVWDDDKLSCAVAMLEQQNAEKPLLYHSNLRIVDENLVFHRNSHATPHTLPDKYSSLVDMVGTGCTMVVNCKTKELIQGRVPDDCTMHDVWLNMVCMFFGTVVYDFVPHISYRQHEGNAVGTYLNKITPKVFLHKCAEIFDPRKQLRYRNAKKFLQQYGDILFPKDLAAVKEVVQYKDSLPNKLTLLFDRKIHGRSKARDFVYRILIILDIA